MCAAVVAQQQGWQHLPVHVMHYDVIGGRHILKCEEWMCQALGLNYVGYLGDLESVATTLGGHSIKAGLRRRFAVFKYSWQSWGRESLPSMDPREVAHLVLPMRGTFSDALLTNLFPSATVHLVLDGAGALFGRGFRFPMKWRLSGLDNPFASGREPQIWGPSFMVRETDAFKGVSQFDEEHWTRIMDRLMDQPDYRAWLKEQFGTSESGTYSILFTQELWIRDGVNPFEEISLWADIIKHELASSPSTLIVKPHPRDSEARLALLRLLVPEKDRERVIFLTPNVFSTLPAEILLRCLPVTAMAGFFSTSLLYANMLPDVEARVYNCRSFPQRLRGRIDTFARAGAFPVHEL